VPSVILIAGPNGAGKTTFANEYLSADDRNFEFLNADEVAREWAQQGDASGPSDIRAGRIMLDRIDKLIGDGADFVIETTRASLTYARKIPRWRRRGYVVTLIYLRLPSISASIARVRRRVEAGGHGIPEEAIRRRFDKSASYLESIYKPIVDVWYLWESQEGCFVLLDSWKQQ
jgi:predicted ABC-type ATPase